MLTLINWFTTLIGYSILFIVSYMIGYYGTCIVISIQLHYRYHFNTNFYQFTNRVGYVDHVYFQIGRWIYTFGYYFNYYTFYQVYKGCQWLYQKLK